MTEAIEKRVKIYPRAITGKFRNIKWGLAALFLGIYFATPWLRMHGRQAVLFDIPARKFYLFNIVIWPQDVFYLTFIFMFLAMLLFFMAAIGGRIWCGYACPQSVFTDLFVSIERFVEGERHDREVLDHAGWGAKKTLKKTAKVVLWLLFSFITSFTFIAYFVPPMELLTRIFTGTLTYANSFWLAFFAGTTYLFCAFLRELICTVACPYGRFQSALTDPDTLIIGYDEKRGEPRGHLQKKGTGEGKALGDCVDCTLCVQVCPMGIDIRNGLQYECIGCALCIDACNQIMRKVHRPEGLIRYGSLNIFGGGKTHVMRPRVALYGAILLILAGGLWYMLASRTPLAIDVIRNRSALFRETEDGRIVNLYAVKIMNMNTTDHRYLLKVEGIPARLVIGNNPLTVKTGEVYETGVSLIMEKKELTGKVTRFRFTIEDLDNKGVKAERESTFLAP